jgi:hypothetical protein
MVLPPSPLNQAREMSDSEARRRPVAEIREGGDESGFNVRAFPSEEGGLGAFETESEIPYRSRARKRVAAAMRPLLIALAAGLVVAAVSLSYMAFRRGTLMTAGFAGTAGQGESASSTTGTAQFDSRPSGAEVLVDGVLRGRTPLKLSLPTGGHTVEIRRDTSSRQLPLTVEPHGLVSQYVELATPDTGRGRLEITSDPPGAQVRVDGQVKGNTPLQLDDVPSGERKVSLTRAGATFERSVTVTSGATASVIASLGARTPGAIGGFVSVRSPLELQVLEDGKLLGSTNAERLMLPTGRHQLDLVNDSLHFRTTARVDVEAGKVATVPVTIPNGSLSVNALPWAEVFLNGRAIGTTPLANLAVPIGHHEIVWRHPQLGERRQAVDVTETKPVRVSVTFSQ